MSLVLHSCPEPQQVASRTEASGSHSSATVKILFMPCSSRKLGSNASYCEVRSTCPELFLDPPRISVANCAYVFVSCFAKPASPALTPQLQHRRPTQIGWNFTTYTHLHILAKHIQCRHVQTLWNTETRTTTTLVPPKNGIIALWPKI